MSVLTTVIGHQPKRGWLLIDAGWMALSRDRGTATQTIDQGYGVVCDVHGSVLPDLIVLQANQEHGVVACRPGSGSSLPELAIGTRLRILPNRRYCPTVAIALSVKASAISVSARSGDRREGVEFRVNLLPTCSEH